MARYEITPTGNLANSEMKPDATLNYLKRGALPINDSVLNITHPQRECDRKASEKKQGRSIGGFFLTICEARNKTIKKGPRKSSSLSNANILKKTTWRKKVITRLLNTSPIGRTN